MDGTRVVVLIVSVCSIICWIVWAVRNKRRWLYAIAPISWLCFTASFYITRIIQVYMHIVIDQKFMNKWAIVIHLSGAILLMGASIIMSCVSKELDEHIELSIELQEELLWK